MHSELPPSSSDKWLNCHGWLNQVRPILSKSPRVSSPAAEEGTLAHFLLEQVLNEKTLFDSSSQLSEVFSGKTEEELAEKFRLYTSEEMQDYVFSVQTQVLNLQKSLDAKLYTEHRIDFGKVFGYVDLAGTSDIVLVSEKALIIGDLKYGRMHVHPDENTQLLTYLVGAIEEFGPREEYQLYIFQPRSHTSISSWEVTQEYLKEFKSKLEEAIRMNFKGGELKVGPWCRNYCPAFATCPAVREHSLKVFKDNPL